MANNIVRRDCTLQTQSHATQKLRDRIFPLTTRWADSPAPGLLGYRQDILGQRRGGYFSGIAWRGTVPGVDQTPHYQEHEKC